MVKKLLLTLIICIFLINLIIAFEFDNSLTYENNDMKVTIKNAFGLGEDLGTAELKSHSFVGEVLKVGYGQEQVVMYYDFEGWNNGNKLGEVYFIDMNTGEEIEKDYYFVEWISYEVEITDYDDSCSNLNDWELIKNCKPKKIGTHFETKWKWEKLDTKDITNKRIGIKTYVEKGDYIDAVWTIAGKKIKKHASWSAGLEANIQNWYKLDEGSGAVVDFYENNNATNTGAVNTTGIINSGYLFVRAENDIIETDNNISITGTDSRAISGWIKKSTDGTIQRIFGYGHCANSKMFGLYIEGNNSLSIIHYANEIYTPQTITGTDWHHIVITYDGTNDYVYYDGNYLTSSSVTIDTGDSTFGIGAIPCLSGNRLDGTIDEVGVWTRNVTSLEVTDLYNGGSALTPVSLSSSPTVTLNTPENNTNFTTNTVQFNCSAWDDVNLTNVSLIIDGSIDQTNSSGLNNSFYYFTKILGDGSYFWSCRGTDNESQITTAGERKFTIETVILNSHTFNTTSYETELNPFVANITYNSSMWDSIETNLYYNSTKYSTTQSAGSGDDLNFSVTVPARLFNPPNVKPFFWNFRLTNATGTFDYNTSSYNQTEQPIQFGLCNATLTVPFTNFSFQDEDTSTAINATIDASTWYYWIGDGTVIKSLTFSNSTVNDNYAFCLSPPNRTLYYNTTIQYASTGYPQRRYVADGTLTNTTTNTTLYLLATADGLYVTFQVINTAQQPIPDVSVNATRNIGGSDVIISQGTTDSSGLVTFWLNPDYTHTLGFSKTGYDTYITNIIPTQSSYTINLGGETTTPTTNYYQGILVRITPTQDFLTNNTLYNFTLNLTSDYWLVSEFGFTLYFGNNTIINAINATTDGGNLSLNNINVTGDSVYLRYYYIANGTTINSQSARTWGMDTTEGTGFSINNFFTNLSTHLTAGLFGATDFTRLVLTFVIVVMSIGALGYNFGIRSEAALGGLLFGIIAILDIGLGFIPAFQIGDMTPIPHFLTFASVLILVGFIFKEVNR